MKTSYTDTLFSTGTKPAAGRWRQPLALLALLLSSSGAWAQTVKTLPGDYANFAAAINDINSSFPNGGVTVNVAAGYAETAPSGGLPPLTAQGTGGATGQIVFRKAGSGTNPLITAPVGSSNALDGIVRLSGADYVTFDGIDLLDPATNNNQIKASEFGYAFFRASATNGCQNNTIQNCKVTMNRSGSGSATTGLYGVYLALTTPTGTAVTPTSAAGSNSSNKFYANTLLNTQSGIFVTGYGDAAPYSLADQNNDFGGQAASTGNTIRNYGGASGVIAFGIRATNQQSPNASFNTLDNAGGGGVATASSLYGVYLTLGASGDITLNNNAVTLVQAPTATTSVTATAVYSGHTGTGTATLNNNAVSYTLAAGGGVASASSRYMVLSSNISAIGGLNMNGNQVTYTLSSTAASSPISGAAHGVSCQGPVGGALNMNDNQVTFTLSNTSSSSLDVAARGVNCQNPVTGAASLSNNAVNYAVSNSGTGTIAASGSAYFGVVNSGAAPSLALNTNTVAYTLTNTSTSAISAACQAVYNGGAVSGVLSMSGNVISHTVPAAPATVGNISGSLLGIFNTVAVPGSLAINNNTFSFAIANGGATISSTMTGVVNQGGTVGGTASFNGNALDFALATAAGVTSSSPIGISNSAGSPLTGAATFSDNTLTYTGTRTGGTFSSDFTGIANYAATSSTLTIDNNTLLGSSTASTGNMTFVLATGASSALVTISNNRYQNSRTASTGSVLFINNSNAVNIATAANLLVQGNSFTGLTRTGAGGTTGYFNIGFATTAGTHTIRNNTVSGLTLLGSFVGIESLATATGAGTSSIAYEVSDNVIGSLASGGGISSTGASPMVGLWAGGTAVSGTLANNTVQNLSGAGQTVGLTLSGNTGVPVSTSNTFFSGTILGNIISNLSTTSGAAVYGMYLPAASAPGGAVSTTANKVTNLSTSSTGAVYGIEVAGGPSHTLSNNIIATLTAPAGTGSPAVAGLYLTAGTAINAYHNTVYLGGTGPGSSAACYRTSTGATTLRNNIFYNARTGSGSNYALATASTTGFVGSTTNPGTNTSDYNLLIAADAAKVGLYGATAYSFADWKTATGGDGSSLSETTTTLPAANLFANPAAGDFFPNAANPAAWYANGTGTQVAGIGTDYVGAPRPTTVPAGAPDLGAFEVTPTALPPALAVSAAPALGGTQVFSLGGRTLARLTYGSTGTVPGSVLARYYSGTNPPAPFLAGARYANAYFEFSDATADGSGYTYQPTLAYDPALLGTIPNEAAQRISPRAADNSGYGTYFATVVSPAPARTLIGPATATPLGLLAIGAAAAPLPVQLSRFEALREGADVLLSWTTATEHDNQGFDVQVSPDGQHFRTLGSVAGAGSSAGPRRYAFTDREAGKTGLRYYRLRQLDQGGPASFSPVRTVQFDAAAGPLLAWPNPCRQALHLSLLLPRAAAAATLTLTDMLGHPVLRQELGPLTAGPSQPTLDSPAFARLPAGLYVLHLATPAGTQTLKLVKE
ncbi:beta strand repeat-containing protein [Hymenobacter armeniacus]|uniref:T9SS type A sorting domain-containing protein n=1 Tax=Hymenobacter armeniacus TaxID=2771358 RepID=A0ABR8JS73_9BACT|nr:T9SS type A sorting domain-containing protein [Hymenobacter armeniacus]MBD2722820.1 T9SS type A sorting domain-containing protein [Hymenobacter armeniacus]